MPDFGKANNPSPGKSVGVVSKVPLIVEPKCLVCKSPHRHLVDQMLVAGLPYSEIERQMAQMGNFPRRSISLHKEKHLGYDEAGIRQIIEREAMLAQRNHEEGVERLITKNSYLEVALQKAYDSLINGDVVVEPKDAVKVIDMLSKLQEQTHLVALDEIKLQFQMFMQAVKEVVPKDQWEGVVERTQQLLKGSGRGLDLTEAQEPELVDAEVVPPA
ncbi:MAG: hypothetical protein NVS9B9_27200 [Ktedonobacteraceae bacterium]